MKIQVRSLAIALAIAVPIAVATTAESSAAPINGTSIKAAVPAATTDVRYRVRRDRGTRGVQRTTGGDTNAWQRAAPSSRR